MKVLDLKFIRYANLFNKVTRIRSKHCFEYNNSIVIGRGKVRLEEMQNILGQYFGIRKVRIK